MGLNHMVVDTLLYCTTNPTWGDIFEYCFKVQTSDVFFHCNVAKETFEL